MVVLYLRTIMKRIKFLLPLLAAMLIVPRMADAQTYGVTTEEKNEQNTPEGWKCVSLPKLSITNPSGTRLQNITAWGASTESSDNHKAIQDAINALPSRGGVVVIPKGTWLTGAITLKSKTILHLEKGATLKLLPMGEWKDGSTSFIQCQSNATNVIVEGEDKESCIIDGQGAAWWAVRDTYGKSSPKWTSLQRPGIIDFQMGDSCFLIKNITIKNSPTSNIRIGKDNKGMHATIHDVIIREPASELHYSASNPEGTNPSHNTDGIPVWTRFVNIYNCDISNGDDNVVMDAGAQYVHVWNCKFGTGHGASIGSFVSNVHDILWENIDFDGTSCGLRLKSNSDRGGDVYNVTMRNCTMKNVPSPISITSWYDSEPKLPATSTDSTADTPCFRDILIQNVTATNVTGESLHLYGRPESYISNITLDNVNIKANQGMFLAYVRNLKFINGCNLTTNAGTYFHTNTSLGGTVAKKGWYEAFSTGTYDGTDVPTGIVSPTVSTVAALVDNNWYNLSGQKVNCGNMSKGIYIHQGKKYVVK